MKKLMMMAMAVVAAVTGSTLQAVDAHSYVQDGLIAQWDGIDNVGTGVHVSETNIWKDLKSGYDLTLTKYGSWGDTWLEVDGPSAYGSKMAPTYKTIEIVYRTAQPTKTDAIFFYGGTTDACKHRAVYFDKNGTYLYFDGATTTAYIPSTLDEDRTAAAVYNDVNLVTTVYSNGVALVNPSTYKDIWNTSASYIVLGSRRIDINTDWPWKGRIYAIRLYNRVLTAEEIAANRKIDGVRFLGETIDDKVEVTMKPEYSGITLDPSGTVKGLAKGDTKTFKAPVDPVEVATGVRATCTGWKLYDIQGALAAEGDGATYDHTHPGTYCRLEWQFKTEYTLTVTTAGSGSGTVLSYDEWHEAGSTCALTATPAVGFKFYGWRGDVDGATCWDSEYTVTFDGVKSIVAYFGKPLYVSPTGSDDSANPYDETTPYKTIAKAVTSANDYDVIQLAAGTYVAQNNYAESVAVAKPVCIAGEGVDKTILSKIQLTLNHADILVQDMRITAYNGGGAITFTKNGAGGTVRRCDISGNTRTGTDGTGVMMYIGYLLDSVITNNINSGGNTGIGIGVDIAATGNCLVRNCLIADNSTGMSGTSGGLGVNGVWGVNGPVVTIEHCTITRNLGGTTGGLYIGGNNASITLRDCLIADNGKLTDAKTAETEDACLNVSGTPATYTRLLQNCIIAKCPTFSDKFQTENCLFNVGAGLIDVYSRDYCIGANSPARGAASDGTDIGWYQTAYEDALAVGCYAVTDRAVGSLTTTLVGTALNAEGTVSYAWDLDGDGTYETEGATVEATFSTPGWQSVRVKATCGEATSEATVEHVALVGPATTYVWTKSPNPTFPYATWATAAHDPQTGLKSVLDGGRLQFTNEAMTVSSPLKVYRRMVVAGTGKDNNSVLGGVSGFTVKKFVDENATGTSIQRTSGDVKNLQLYNSGSLVHSIAFGPGRDRVVCIYGESILSNCVARYGEYTSGSGDGIWASAGLITHCVISNNYSYGGGSGGEVYLEGTAKMRNSLVTGGLHTSTTAPGCQGAVYANGPSTEVSNCTICNNKAGYGAGLYTTGAAKVFNNIIRDNTTTCDASEHIDWYDATGTAVYSNNCMAVAHNAGDGTVTSLPGFINNADGTCSWTFQASSPCANMGLNLAWMIDGATDLFGNDRVQGDSVDIGCFEADMSQATCGISASPSEVFAATNITFKAVVTGGALPSTAAYLWDFDGDGEYENLGATVVRWCDEGRHTTNLKIVDGDKVLFDVKGATDLVTVYPKALYFNAANAVEASFPYNTPETAAAKMSDVMASAKSGCTIYVLAGRHDCDQQITLGGGVSMKAVAGLSTRPTLVRREATSSSSLLIISGTDAVVEGLVFDDNKMYSQNVVMNGGTMVDCVISNAFYTSGGGIGFSMNAGLLDRCTVVDIRGSASSDINSCGLIAQIKGGTVRNTLFTGNYCYTEGEGRKGGLISVQQTGVLENCTIVANTNRTCAVVTTLEGGSVRNCLVYGNLAGRAIRPIARGANSAIVDDETGTADSNYNAYELGEGEKVFGANDVVLTNSPFATRVTKMYPAYTPAEKSPVVDAGTNAVWMSDGVDHNGFSRVRNGRVDIGACERQVPGFTIILR